MNKKICILKQRLGHTGGLEKATLKIAEGFAKKGHSVTLVCTSEKSSSLPSFIQYQQIPVHLPTSFMKISYFDFKASIHIKKNSYDIVFGMERNQNPTHVRLGNGIHKVYLEKRKAICSPFKNFTTSLNPLHRLLLSLEKKTLENPELKAVFTNSNMVKKELIETYSTAADKIHVIHNGVEWDAYQYDFENWVEKKHKHLRDFQLQFSDYQFLFVGHGFERKGLDYLLRALALIRDKTFHLSVIGKDKKLPFYKELAEKLGLKKQVTFFGEQKNIKPFYQLADALVIPSFYDPFANVTLEALAMGLVVISSLSNGGSEVLTPESGLLIENIKDCTHLATQLEKAMTRKKTWQSSHTIRSSVKHLDFSLQNSKLVDICLKTC